MSIDELVDKIIPPPYHQYRHEFSNVPIINELTEPERELVADKLIDKLKENRYDSLIYETLAYMNVTKALPELYVCFEHCNQPANHFILACSVYQLSKDEQLIDEIVSDFKQMDSLPKRDHVHSFFYYLWEIKHERIINLVRGYVNDSEHLISHKAKQALVHLEHNN